LPYNRGGIYYIKRTLPGIGRVYRTLGTRSKGRARTMEEIVLRLCERGHLEPVRAFLDGTISAHELADAFDGGTLHELARDLRAGSVTLRDAVRDALASKEPDVRASTFERYRQAAAHVERVAALEGVATVRETCSPAHIQRHKRIRLTEGAHRLTVNKDLQALSMLASYALERGWIEKRPKIKRYAAPDRIRYLEPDELAAYMAAVRRLFRPQMQVLVGSGMRLGETEQLRPCDIKFGAGECRALLRDAKSTAGVRPVYVPEWAAEPLRALTDGRPATARIFDIPRRTVQEEHKRTCRIAGIASYRLHDHRHTAAVSLARAGMPLPTLQKQLGHRSIQQTMKYAQFHPDYHDVGRFFRRVEERFGLGQGAVRGAAPPEHESEART